MRGWQANFSVGVGVGQMGGMGGEGRMGEMGGRMGGMGGHDMGGMGGGMGGMGGGMGGGGGGGGMNWGGLGKLVSGMQGAQQSTGDNASYGDLQNQCVSPPRMTPWEPVSVVCKSHQGVVPHEAVGRTLHQPQLPS